MVHQPHTPAARSRSSQSKDCCRSREGDEIRPILWTQKGTVVTPTHTMGALRTQVMPSQPHGLGAKNAERLQPLGAKAPTQQGPLDIQNILQFCMDYFCPMLISCFLQPYPSHTVSSFHLSIIYS